VEAIDPMLLGAGRGRYVECDAWAWLANARRAACDLRGAHEALKRAYDSYDQGTQTTLRMAKLLDYEGSLRRDQDCFDEALPCLDRALDIYRDARAEPHLTAKLLIQKGTVYGRACRPERAVPVLRQAVALLDPQLHRPLLLSGYQILAACLCENGRHEEAAKLLPLVDELASESDQGMDRARVEWLRARVEAGTGKAESAIRRLRTTQQLFLDLASPYDAAVVGLDLATIYVETGRREEMLALARTMAPVLQSGDLHREAVTALTILNRALKNNDLPADLIRRLRTYLKQARFHRDLRFEDVT
ncbi:MAG: tetratricopeptide repeat protein, partial [bacterium]|nr:tetratricopeptide repeat protein [bacterium]